MQQGLRVPPNVRQPLTVQGMATQIECLTRRPCWSFSVGCISKLRKQGPHCCRRRSFYVSGQLDYAPIA